MVSASIPRSSASATAACSTRSRVRGRRFGAVSVSATSTSVATRVYSVRRRSEPPADAARALAGEVAVVVRPQVAPDLPAVPREAVDAVGRQRQPERLVVGPPRDAPRRPARRSQGPEPRQVRALVARARVWVDDRGARAELRRRRGPGRECEQRARDQRDDPCCSVSRHAVAAYSARVADPGLPHRPGSPRCCHHRHMRAAWTLMLMMAALLLPVASSSAETVTTLGDSGDGSLRAAIANAAPGETIDFQAGLEGTIELATELTVGTLKLKLGARR